jgi:Asp-tRNA(Asn)/Glu-tRNA(Gln) amidotransferase A subunit family amidase
MSLLMPYTIDRRTLTRLLPILAAAVVAPDLEAQNPAPTAPQQPQRPAPPPQVVTKEMLHHALATIGIELTDAQETMALQGVNRNYASYLQLRQIAIPLDTEPAVRFLPAAPSITRARFAPTKPAHPKFSSIDDLAFRPATALGALLRARRITSTDLTRMYLARLKKYSPKMNCVITLTEDRALEQAARADAEIRRGHHRGPLHGVPYGAKDLFATKGIKTTWGAEPYQNQVPEYTATVIERLDNAGAVLLAKLSMGALAQGDLWFGGMTRNPWNIEQGSSGSSAGSAAATSGGLVGFSVGTETLGSIVSPSTRCGVVGLRPTYGRISRYGAMGLSWTMDKIGPICRTVEDCAVVLETAKGPDGHDLTVVDAPLNWQPHLGLSGLRIGYLKADFDRATGDAKAIYERVLADLQKAGFKMAPVELPKFNAAPLRVILEAEAAAAFDDLTRDKGVDQLSGQRPNDWPNSFRTSRVIPAVEYIRAQRARTLLMREMEDFMADWDVLVSPPFGGSLLLVTNLTGNPQIVVPCGFVNNNSPSGLVFTGKVYDEGSPMRAALVYEKATEWHTMHPKMDWPDKAT